jgi:cytochrome c-type biogenesis protein CcmH/NrfG
MGLAKSAFIILILIVASLTQINCGQAGADDRLASLESEVQRHPESGQAQYELGVAYLESNKDSNYTKAIGALKQAIKLKPDFAEAYCKLGDAYDVFHHHQLRSDHSAEEIEAYSKAIEINPNYAEAFVGLGKIFI